MILKQKIKKIRQIIALGLVIGLISVALFSCSLPRAEAKVKFGPFCAYGGTVIKYITYMGIEFIIYKQYETNGTSIKSMIGFLNINYAVIKGPCKVPGSSLIGYGLGFGSGYGSAGKALVLWCTSAGLVNF